MPNDVIFEAGERIRVITGPNMSGKSTYPAPGRFNLLMAQTAATCRPRGAG